MSFLVMICLFQLREKFRESLVVVIFYFFFIVVVGGVEWFEELFLFLLLS